MYAQLLQHLLPTFEPLPSSAITRAPSPELNFLQVLEEEQARLQAAISGNEAEPLVKAEEAGVPQAAPVEADGAEQPAETEMLTAGTACWPAACLPGTTESETSGSEAGTSTNPHESEEQGRPLAERIESAALKEGEPLAGSMRGAAHRAAPSIAPAASLESATAGEAAPAGAVTGVPRGPTLASMVRGDSEAAKRAAPVTETGPANLEANESGSHSGAAFASLLRSPWQMRQPMAETKPSLLLKGVPGDTPPLAAPGESQAAATLWTAGAPAPVGDAPQAAPLAAGTDPITGPQASLHEEAEAETPRSPAHGPRGMPDRTEPSGAVVRPPAGESSAPPGQAAAAVRQASDAAPKAMAEPGPPQAPPEPRATLQSLGSHAVRGVRYLVSNGDRTMTVRLSPASLGEVRLEVHANSDGLSVRIASANQAVRHVLESQMPALREAFAREGIEVARVEVSPNLSANTGSMGSHQPAGREPGPFGQGTQQPPAYGGERHSKEPADRKPRAKPATAHLGAVDLYV